MFRYVLLSLVFILLFSCNTYNIIDIGNTDISTSEKKKSSKKFKYKKSTFDPLSYAPYPEKKQWNYERSIRVNVHFMHDSTSIQNIPEEEVEKFALYLIYYASERLKKNKQMALPEGNETPVLMPNYRYQLSPNKKEAVYIHHDNDLWYYVDRGRNRNNYSRDVIKKYAVGEDSILNIFIIPHHPDSIDSKTYPGHIGGIALGHSLKLTGNFHTENFKFSAFNAIFNHETGHILGLSHSWTRSDGCDDTPSHANCYSTTGIPPCDGPYSNNMMDYNKEEITLTPCQIGKIHKNFARIGSRQRSMIIPKWCDLDTSKIIIIKDSVIWLGSNDLQNNVVIEDGGVLDIRCRISMPKASSILVKPGGVLILDDAHIHNSCGDEWNGIKVESEGKKKGLIQYKNNVLIEDVKEDILVPKY